MSEMRISYQPQGRCLWHLDCSVGLGGSGIMHVIQHEEARSLLECGHCHRRGYYPVGAAGPVRVPVTRGESR
jgi:hypothetical protein